MKLRNLMCLMVVVVITIFSAGSVFATPNSAKIVTDSLVQGDVGSSMSANTYAQETNHLDDWALDTGSWGGSTTAVSTTNSNFNGSSWGGTPNTMVAFGNGGSVTLELDSAISGVVGEKEFGLFTAQAIATSNGSLFNGNMEASILLSSDGTNWVTLSGVSVAQNYTAVSSKLNTPTVAYDFGTLSTAWVYGSPGTSQDNLDALTVADYITPMANENLFNGSGTNAERLAMKNNNSTDDYDAIFGTSGGGNWFDISNCGLDGVEYIQLNAVNCAPAMGIRLDAVYTTAAAVPEPTTIAIFGLGGLLLRRRRK